MRFYLILLICHFELSGGNRRSTNSFECGKANEKFLNAGRTINSLPGDNPWHVGVYKYGRKGYENICCGSILSPHIILSAANCFYDISTRKKDDPANYKIVGGKIAFDWNIADHNAQEIDVDDIYIADNYEGDNIHYIKNIALVSLVNDFDFNEYIHAICIPWNDAKVDQSWKYIGASGWGFKREGKYSSDLRQAVLPFLSKRDCLRKFPNIKYTRYINADKFCVLTEEGRKDGDSGSGIIFQNRGINYIHGILSAKNGQEFSVATNVSRYLPWIKGVMQQIDKKQRCDGFKCTTGECVDEKLKCDGSNDCPDGSDESDMHCGNPQNSGATRKGSCMLPNQKGGVSYQVVDCVEEPCILKPHTYVEAKTKVAVFCGRGHAIAEGKLNTVACIDGNWFHSSPECLKLCPKLRSPMVTTKCVFKGARTDCPDYSLPGTLTEYKCQRHFKVKDSTAFSGKSLCLPSGEWREQLPTCIPECGFLNRKSDAQLTIAGGRDVPYLKYPWHVGLYKLYSNDSYVNICGGTIIHQHMILTAAHCLYNENNKPFPVDILKVAAGKFKRNFYDHEEDQLSLNVKNLIIPDTYIGFKGRFAHDIAIINLEGNFHLNDYILPICIDWLNYGIYPIDTFGTIVGWGLNNGQYSELLQEIELPIQSLAQCRKTYEYFLTFLTVDKFCTVNINGSGPNHGDSGGGMTFPRGNVHFIHGIISLKPSDNIKFAVLTNVSNHLPWIRTQIQVYSRTSSEISDVRIF